MVQAWGWPFVSALPNVMEQKLISIQVKMEQPSLFALQKIVKMVMNNLGEGRRNLNVQKKKATVYDSPGLMHRPNQYFNL